MWSDPSLAVHGNPYVRVTILTPAAAHHFTRSRINHTVPWNPVSGKPRNPLFSRTRNPQGSGEDTERPPGAGVRCRREYWRGPTWPVITWLYGWAFGRRGWTEPAEQLRTEGLRLVVDGTFAEQYHPYAGEPLGSQHQSWTAAVVLDWLH